MKQEAAAEEKSGKRQSREFSAKQKAQAVLALWSGRRSPSALTKELGVPWAAINTWEKRALSGMLTALDPTWKQTAEEQPSLPRRVEKLIEQTVRPAVAEPAAAN
jgi:hypothetical protein